jgi:hypothetical protein
MSEPPSPPHPSDPADTVDDRGTGRRQAVLGGVAAAVILAGGYGAYAIYDKLDGGGPQPHDVLPASTQVYARLDLDPSASQKIALLKLVRKVPDLAEEIGIESADQDVRRLVFDELISSDCPDVDYDEDVEPWLGSRIGIGANVEDKTFQIAVQTTDETSSRAGIKKLFACSGEDYGIAYLDGYAIVSDSQKAVDTAVDATAKGTLGDRKAFTDDFDALGDQGIVSAWADVDGIAKSPDVAESLGGAVDDYAGAGSGAMTLRVDGNALELVALSGRTSTGDVPNSTLDRLPADTVAALSLTGLGDQVGPAFDSLVEELGSGLGAFAAPDFAFEAPEGGPDVYSDEPPSSGDDVQDFLDEVERDTGFRLREDLMTLFGDSLTLAVGGENLETLPTLGGPDELASLDVALALVSDRTKALDLVRRIADLAERAGITLVAEPTDDGAVLATNAEAAKALSEPGGRLGDSVTFREAVPDAERSRGGLFVDIGAIVDTLQQADPPEDVAKDLAQLEKLSALGISIAEDDDHQVARLRLTFTG